MPSEKKNKIAILTATDIVTARREGRELALKLGFSSTEATLIATAISELARNIIVYATSGEIQLDTVRHAGRVGVAVTARDSGPGIRDVQRALMGGFSTSGGLGLGLSGIRRIMDDLDINSKPGKGTTITTRKWLL